MGTEKHSDEFIAKSVGIKPPFPARNKTTKTLFLLRPRQKFRNTYAHLIAEAVFEDTSLQSRLPHSI
jgi:hypothetical protein